MATAKKPAAKKAAVKKSPTTRPAVKSVVVVAKPALATGAAIPAAAAPAPKSAAKPAPKAASAATAKPAKAAREPKVKKHKPVRDSFTMPKAEYAALDALKLRSHKLASPVKKSELLRAGVKALTAMSDAAFLTAVKAVPTIKTGRPSAK